MVTEGEDYFIGAETVTGMKLRNVKVNEFAVYLLGFELEERIRDCDDEPLITPCLKKYFETKYGTSYENRFNFTQDLALTNFAGYDNLKKVTGCRLPCKSTKYKIDDFNKFPMDDAVQPGMLKFLKSQNDSTIPAILINHQKVTEVKQYQEVLEYNGNKFIGDAGGIIGIFVGLSFWSIYGDFIAPIISFIERWIQY